MAEPCVVTFIRPGDNAPCPMAVMLDTDVETATERVSSQEGALHLAMTLTRGPGSYLPKRAETAHNVLDYPLDDDSGLSFAVIKESDGVQETTRFGQLTMNDRGQRRYIARIGAMTSDEMAMTTQNLVTRFINSWQHLVLEQFKVVTRNDIEVEPETPERIAEHARGHLDDMLRMYHIDAQSDVVCVTFDRVVELDGATYTFTMIERVFDDRISTSLNETVIAAMTATAQRHSTIRVPGAQAISATD